MNIRKIAFGATAATSVSLVAAFSYYAPKMLQAQDVANRIACDVIKANAAKNGIDYEPSTLCRLAAKL